MTTATDPITRTARHTPGPWNDDGQFIVAPDPNGVHPDIYIAELVQEDEEGRFASPEQQQANGNLIAATPELLTALCRASFLLRRIHEGDHNALRNALECAESADSIIAEATGGAT